LRRNTATRQAITSSPWRNAGARLILRALRGATWAPRTRIR
jgi:hypothetical protein